MQWQRDLKLKSSDSGRRDCAGTRSYTLSRGIPMNLDQQRLCIELQHLDWARQLQAEVIQDIAAAQLTELPAGQVVIQLDSEINTVYFVVTGRLEGALFDRLGKQIHRDTFQRGSAVGLFSVLLPERSHLHVDAVVPTTVIQLPLDELLRLTAQYREFQLTMLRIAANIVKHLVMIDRELPKPAASIAWRTISTA
jgi:CRP-like cAMP-binding protein